MAIIVNGQARVGVRVAAPSGGGGGGIVTNGLILNLDAGNAASYPGTGTVWTDLSGQGNHATLVNGVGYSSADGGSLVFDGSNDYALKQNFNNPPTNVLTFGGWIKISNTSGGRMALSLGRNLGPPTGGEALFAYGLGGSLDSLFFEFGSGKGRVNSGVVPTLNTWYHVYVTADGTNTKFYLNGVLKNTSLQNGGSVAHTPGLSTALIASDGYSIIGYYHSGNISNINVYNRALTDAEVLQNYNALKSRYGL